MKTDLSVREMHLRINPHDPPTRSVRGSHAGSDGALRKARPRRRPDVSASFTVILVCAVANGVLLVGDVLRQHAGFGPSLAFAAKHPLTYLVACCVALLAGLLVIGDV